MIGIAKDFSKIDNFEEFIENQDEYSDDDITSSNEMSIDETSKNWSDEVAKNFMQTVSNDVKVILSVLPKLSSPYNEQNARNEQNFDTNNELGVTNYMDTSFVISQLYSFGVFTSVDAFIASIEEKSNKIKELYGLGQLVHDMKKDRVLANRMFSTFAKPIMHKTMVTISNYYSDGGIVFDVRNESYLPDFFAKDKKLIKLQHDSFSQMDMNCINKLKKYGIAMASIEDMEGLDDNIIKLLHR